MIVPSVAALLLFAAQPELRDEIASADKACAKGVSLGVQLERRSAQQWFSAGLTHYFNALAALDSLQPVARCALEAGIVAESEAEADAAFALALALWPGVRPDARVHGPRANEAFQRTLKRLLRVRAGTLSLAGEPRGAEVLLDGKAVGVLPLSVANVAPGEHWLLVKAPLRQPHAARLLVKTLENTHANIFLRSDGPSPAPAPASEAVSIAPTPARTPLALAFLPFGIAQFIEHRPLAGALFLGTQAVLLATNIALFWVTTARRETDGGYRDAAGIRTMQWVINISFGVLIADIIAGCIEGVIQR